VVNIVKQNQYISSADTNRIVFDLVTPPSIGTQAISWNEFGLGTFVNTGFYSIFLELETTDTTVQNVVLTMYINNSPIAKFGCYINAMIGNQNSPLACSINKNLYITNSSTVYFEIDSSTSIVITSRLVAYTTTID
jgi:hypothetical protein